MIDPQYRPAVYLGALAGLRQGEVFALRWSRVNFLARELTVDATLTRPAGRRAGEPGYQPVLSAPKTRSRIRTVPLAERLLFALSEHRQVFGVVDDDVVFRQLRGGMMRRQSFNDGPWAGGLRAVGLEGRRFHELRNTFASTLLASGAAIYEVSRVLGHASITETVDTYGHLMPDARDRSRALIDAVYGTVGIALGPSAAGQFEAN